MGYLGDVFTERANLSLPPQKLFIFFSPGVGYCRSDGISVMFLQKQKDAKRIYCTLVHSRVNSDGNKKHGKYFETLSMKKYRDFFFFQTQKLKISLENFLIFFIISPKTFFITSPKTLIVDTR